MSSVHNLRPELVGIQGMNAFFMHNSSPRGIMFGSHFAQHITLIEADEHPIVTEYHYEMAKYTFGVRMPRDGTIVKVIPKVKPSISGHNFNPESTVIFRDMDGMYDSFKIPYKIAHHQHFGFRAVPNPAIPRITEGMSFRKDTTFADSPGVKEDGSYAYGRVLNIAFMTHQSSAEDAVIFSQSAIEKMKFRVYYKRTLNVTPDCFLLNLHGDDSNYKPIPDLGDFVGEQNILMCTRQHSSLYTPTDMSVKACQTVDFISDKPVFAAGPGGKVVDIEVIGNHGDIARLPHEMREQLNSYRKMTTEYHRNIYQTVMKLRTDEERMVGKGNAKISEGLKREAVVGMAITNHASHILKPTLSLNHRMEPLGEVRITITLEYEITPHKAFKITDSHGG